MRIKLYYRPFYTGDNIVTQEEGETEFKREFVLEDGARVQDVLPQVCAKALVPYSKKEGQVIGSYTDKGLLVDGECYAILSRDVRGTIVAMSA